MITNARTKLWTREEFHRLYESGFFGPEDRVELIEGELVLMAPPGPQHTDPIKYGNKTLVRLYGETHDLEFRLLRSPGLLSRPEHPAATNSWTPLSAGRLFRAARKKRPVRRFFCECSGF